MSRKISHPWVGMSHRGWIAGPATTGITSAPSARRSSDRSAGPAAARRPPPALLTPHWGETKGAPKAPLGGLPQVCKLYQHPARLLRGQQRSSGLLPLQVHPQPPHLILQILDRERLISRPPRLKLDMCLISASQTLFVWRCFRQSGSRPGSFRVAATTRPLTSLRIGEK